MEPISMSIGKDRPSHKDSGCFRVLLVTALLLYVAISLSLGHDGLRDNSSKASIDYLVVAVRTFINQVRALPTLASSCP